MIDITKVYSSNRYGDFTVFDYKGYDDVGIEFIDTGYRYYVEACQITRGAIKDGEKHEYLY